MTLEMLQNQMNAAMKAGDKPRKELLSTLIDASRKAAITPKGRVEITSEIIDTVILKEKKTIQEMIDTCPKERQDLLDKYELNMAIISLYAPKIISDPTEIIAIVNDSGIEPIKANRGKIMSLFKGKADMKVVNQIVATMLH